ncbi:DNA polymerase III subunit alpha [Pediococcus argentinicus]|uniref:DNA polymerase III subunit alpha n=1 Tax=Pediococcus argentinicus TaxID=480391 RepID=UPI00070EF9C3|nr:DNA polymerase III subunit alpha [Pediococcus argentinicus]NKZ21536.1 DNA polymerase III subunit alpha [Pediococcus argentinicus]GEP18665.1 DNA-directed DNA polymerase [Pediococcus argentinicus]
MSFLPLQVSSAYSLLKSSLKIQDLVQSAKKLGYQTLGLADENVMYGAIEFYQECERNGIKPVLGLNLALQGSFLTEETYQTLFFAKGQTGYQNLMQLSSLKMASDKSSLSFTDLNGLLDDLVMIIPGTRSEMIELLERGQRSSVEQLLKSYLDEISYDNLYLGLNQKQTAILRGTVQEVATEFKLKCLPLPLVHYKTAEDYFATKVLEDIHSGDVIRHPEDFKNTLGSDWLKSASDFETEYQNLGLGQEISNLEKLEEQLNLKIQFSEPKLPVFKTPNNSSSSEYLRALCDEGLNKITLVTDRTKYQERLDHELSVIKTMGFSDYFLIIQDVIRFSHSVNILTGPGRGSAAGSLVAYLLNITTVDPLQFGLLFERFLNPERAQMPDVDLDIPDDRRDEVLQYVHEKYGHTRVAQIITFGTLAAKAVIRDVARVFGELPAQINTISKLIPNQLNITLKQAYELSQPLRNFVSDNDRNQLIFYVASRLEGLPRHYSTHAAGIVLSDVELVNNAPVQMGNDGMLMVQYSKNYVEQVGLLKIDFLGLRNLTILSQVLDQVHKEQPDFDINKINLNDKATLELFQKGDTTGIFQFESDGIRNVLVKMQPDNFNLVVAVNALYRPGPMQNIDRFIKRKNHEEPYRFPNEVLKNILGETYGILVYQEQVMEVASAMGGLTLGQADLLRRAMSKKKATVIDELKGEFIKGANQKGYATNLANQVYDYIESFANYGFNKSHAVAYSKMAYQLAYLKVNYPLEFYTAILNSVIGGANKTKNYFQELKQKKLIVLPPNINQSSAVYQLIDHHIVMGLLCIKGIRRDLIQTILTERQANGPFQSVESFLRRIDSKWLSEDVLDRLIFAGALDGFGYNRAELSGFLPELKQSIDLSNGSMDLFEKLIPKVQRKPDLSLSTKLEQEEELLGVYVSGHPVEKYQKLIDQIKSTPLINLKESTKVVVVAYIKSIRVIRTKKGDQMAFLNINDPSGESEVVVFPQVFKNSESNLQRGRVLVIQGKSENRNGKLQIIADSFKLPEEMHLRENKRQRWILNVPHRKNSRDFQMKLFGIFKKYHGNIPVTLVYLDTHETNDLSEEFNLSNVSQAKEELADLLGVDQIQLKNDENQN